MLDAVAVGGCDSGVDRGGAATTSEAISGALLERGGENRIGVRKLGNAGELSLVRRDRLRHGPFDGHGERTLAAQLRGKIIAHQLHGVEPLAQLFMIYIFIPDRRWRDRRGG